MNDQQLSPRNKLLEHIPVSTLSAMRSRMKRITLHRDMVLAEQGRAVESVFFPEGGVISLLDNADEDRTEVGIVGSEGLVGMGAVLDDDMVHMQAVVQVDGTTAMAMEADAFRDAMEQSPELHSVARRFVSCFFLQVSTAIYSCARQFMDARLARWLLMCHDRMDSDDIPITHEYIAMMIASQRTGVTGALHQLEGDGMIRSTRGLVTILDRPALLSLAGEGYGRSEESYRRLIGPFGK